MTKNFKLCDLIEDFTLYPRQGVDSTNVIAIADILTAGGTVPPPTVDKKTLRISDGFHRTRAYRRVFEADYKILCEVVDYATEAELFLDAIRRNSGHGKRMNHNDQARANVRAQELGVSEEEVATSMGLTMERFQKLMEYRFTGTKTDKRPDCVLKNTVRHMANTGKRLTKAQVEAMPKLGGMNQLFYVNQVLLLINNGMLDMANEKLMERLDELADKITDLRKAVAA
jgi:hypothetical protein